MARQVVIDEKEPKTISIGGESVKICMCGLSKNLPFCDDSEKATLDEIEGVIYVYDENHNKIGAFEEVEGMDGCCGGGCCGGGGGACGHHEEEE